MPKPDDLNPYVQPITLPEPQPPASSSRWSADLALLGVALMWGVNIPIMKHGVGLIDRLGFNALRLTLSAAVLGVMVLLEPRKDVRSRPWMKILLVSVFSGFVYQLTFVLGIRKTLAGNTALILSCTPMWTALLAWMWGLEKLRKLAWVGLAMTCIGAGLVAFAPSKMDLGSDYLEGNLLILLASFMWALASVLSKPLFEYITPTRLAFLSAAVTLPLHYVLAGPDLVRESLQTVSSNSTALWCVVYSGLFSTGFAYALWNYGVRKVGPSHASIYQNLVPVVALSSGWMIIGEVVTGAQIPGGILILAGLLLMRRGR